MHLLVAGLALQLAWRSRPVADANAVGPSAAGPGGGGSGGSGQSTTDPTGALAVLAESTAGRVLLWLLTVAFAALTLWQAVEVLRHRRSLPRPGGDRRRALLQLLRTLGSAAVYGWLT